MNAKIINGLLIVTIILLLLSVYWFVPLNITEFGLSSDTNYNFSLNSYENNSLQFYPNMRFSHTNISYRIEKCPLDRKNDMERAFEIIEEETVLEFYPVLYNQEISINCSDVVVESEGENTYEAGLGGPGNPTKAGNFNVIPNGTITLFKYSKCERPNVALHELLHVLGFDHSDNPNNIMYPYTKCSQTLGEDTIEFINEIYSIPSNPDLLFENTPPPSMHGKYLDVNFSIKNYGLNDSGESFVKIIADGKEVQIIEIPPIKIGEGRRVSIVNIWIKQIGVEEIEYIIENDFGELDKTNNYIVFKIKK